MKKWLEWQIKNQIRNADWENHIWFLDGLSEKLGSWFDRIINDYESNNIEAKFFNYFTEDFRIRSCVDSSDGQIQEDEFRQWLDEYADLMKGNGHFYIYDFGADTDYIRNTVTEKFKLKNNDLLQIRVQIELPGQYFVVHIDSVKGGAEHIQTFVTFMRDQSMGQIFGFDKKTINWKKGDVVTWDFASIPHYTANVGYEPSYFFVVVGEPLDVPDH
jgi:hypothetical protein